MVEKLEETNDQMAEAEMDTKDAQDKWNQSIKNINA